MSLVFFFGSDAMAGAIACGQTIQIKIQQASKQACEPINNQENKQAMSLVFVWSDAMAGAIACGQAIQIKIQQASNHANQHKLMTLYTQTNKQANK